MLSHFNLRQFVDDVGRAFEDLEPLSDADKAAILRVPMDRDDFCFRDVVLDAHPIDLLPFGTHLLVGHVSPAVDEYLLPTTIYAIVSTILVLHPASRVEDDVWSRFRSEPLPHGGNLRDEKHYLDFWGADEQASCAALQLVGKWDGASQHDYSHCKPEHRNLLLAAFGIAAIVPGPIRGLARFAIGLRN